MTVLRFSALVEGAQEAELALDALYDQAALARFEARWEAFFASDAAHPFIFHKTGARLRYQTGYFVPTLQDARPPVLLLFGNPASHSTRIGMCFSYEGNQRKHRFWSVLAESGFLAFPPDSADDTLDTVARNAKTKRDFFGLAYASPFRIGIAPIFSMPSTASAPPWSGVGGLYKLFGKAALTTIAQAEKARVRGIIQTFLADSGVLVAFQKDAYEHTRLPDSPPYALEAVKAQLLASRYVENPAIPLFVGAPTRFWTGRAIRQGLQALRHTVEQHLQQESLLL